MPAVYLKGAALPDTSLSLFDDNKDPINLTSGYTFQLKVTNPGSTTALFTKSSGITGTATGATLAWATSAEITTLEIGTYDAELVATRQSDSKPRKFKFPLTIDKAAT